MLAEFDIPALMAARRISGLALVVTRRAGVLASGGWGHAGGSGRPVAAETVFEAASLGKPVFAYLVLRLVDAGALSLDETLAGRAPDLFGADMAEVTARHLLSHTSGLPNWRSAERPLACHFPPGRRFSYSGEGYVLLQQVIERICGQPLERLAQRHVFEPLGMPSTAFDGARLPPDVAALPHDSEGVAQPKVWMAPNAAASLHATALDYGRFLQAALSAEGLSAAAARAWLTPQARVPARFFAALDPVGDPEVDERVGWGLGWGIDGDGGFFHWGSNPGFKSFAIGSVPEDRALVVLSTGESELALGPELARAVFDRARPCLDWFAGG